ncbi:MAG: DinB family protein [Acidimicrobiales bacterium]
MVDQKPPRLEGSERETLLALLQYQRDSLIRKISGVSEEGARTSPVASGTSLLWLLRHMARAESLWILHRFAGHEVVIDDEVRPEDTVPSAVAAYRETCRRSDAVVASTPSLDAPCRDAGVEGPVSLRWVLMHLLEETARHAGHADILRELIDGQTGR